MDRQAAKRGAWGSRRAKGAGRQLGCQVAKGHGWQNPSAVQEDSPMVHGGQEAWRRRSPANQEALQRRSRGHWAVSQQPPRMVEPLAHGCQEALRRRSLGHQEAQRRRTPEEKMQVPVVAQT